MADKKTDTKVEKNQSKTTKAKKPNFFSKAAKFLRECKGELKKIVWPTAGSVTKNFGVVIAVIVIVGLFIFGLDRGLYALLGLVMNISAT